MVMHDAIVLAGGAGRRLSGPDKPEELVGGATMLERAVDAAKAAGARTVIVVGPHRRVHSPVAWTQESPPGGGPAAALGAGLRFVETEAVLLLAADLPFAAPALPRLLACLDADADVEGAVVVDAAARDQYLLAAYRTGPLRVALTGAGELHGLALRDVVGRLRLARVRASGEEALDCDTPARLAWARAIASDRGTEPAS
jgi:molybdopterin-guanine dinucleotide biosynthesis protein A